MDRRLRFLWYLPLRIIISLVFWFILILLLGQWGNPDHSLEEKISLYFMWVALFVIVSYVLSGIWRFLKFLTKKIGITKGSTTKGAYIKNWVFNPRFAYLQARVFLGIVFIILLFVIEAINGNLKIENSIFSNSLIIFFGFVIASYLITHVARPLVRSGFLGKFVSVWGDYTRSGSRGGGNMGRCPVCGSVPQGTGTDNLPFCSSACKRAWYGRK